VEAAYLTALMDQSTISGILLPQVLTLGISGWLAFHGHMTVGTLAGFQSLAVGVSTSLLSFTPYLRGLLPARAGLHRIEEFLAPPSTSRTRNLRLFQGCGRDRERKRHRN
jgi:ABC-type bacteriocin/lantibiotic exporter with double-glycine peptidase domain